MAEEPPKPNPVRRANAHALRGARWRGTIVRVRNAQSLHLNKSRGLGEGTAAGGRQELTVFRDERDVESALA